VTLQGNISCFLDFLRFSLFFLGLGLLQSAVEEGEGFFVSFCVYLFVFYCIKKKTPVKEKLEKKSRIINDMITVIWESEQAKY